MRKSRRAIITLLTAFFLLGLSGISVRAQHGGGHSEATPEPVNKWWEIPKIKPPGEEAGPQQGFLSQWFPDLFPLAEPGKPQPNIFVRVWRSFTGLFRKKAPQNLPPGWKRPLEDPVEVEVTPLPTPPIPAGYAYFDPASGTLSITGVSLTVTKPPPPKPASHERASKIAREMIVNEIANLPTDQGVALSEMMTSRDVDAMRAQMQEVFAGKQLDRTWVATIQLDLRQFPLIRKNCSNLLASKIPWTRQLTQINP